MRSILVAACILISSLQLAHAADAHTAAEQLRKSELLWKHTAPYRYSLRVKYSTFAGHYGCWEQSFRVKGRHSSSDSAPDCDSRPDKFGSIPALFRFARELLAENPDEAEIEYDPAYGYPKNFYVGSTHMEDSYFKFEVLDFKAGDPEGGP